MLHYSVNKQVASWLFISAIMIVLMVAIGGVTRLTHSGLSIVDWRPITGVIPPLSDQDWESEFSKYKTSPEFKKINFSMELKDFKPIYLMEYFHRLAARITGLVFLLPFLYFWFTKKINHSQLFRLAGIFILGGVQGFIGWYMVKSGLLKDPSVSHVRLTLHLIMAFIIFALIFWNALNYWYDDAKLINKKDNFYRKMQCLLALTFIQIITGGFVAGLHGGLIYNSFPLMDGKFIPIDILMLRPWYKNFIDNITTIQFMHRLLGISILSFVFYITLKAYTNCNNTLIKYMNILAGIIIIQVTLGVTTLINSVPIILASLHQLVALIFFATALFITHRTMRHNYSCGK